MSYDGLLISVLTTKHRYIVRRDQILETRLVLNQSDLERPDERGKAIISQELGTLLDPEDVRSNPRRHALIIPTRRRGIALLVERIENVHMEHDCQIHKLPKIFARQLERPWFLGILVENDSPFLILDLRQIAQDVLFMQKKPAPETTQTVTTMEENNQTAPPTV